jgi:hypothetical protein
MLLPSHQAAADALESNLAAIRAGAAPDEGLVLIIRPLIRFFPDKERKELALEVWATMADLTDQSPESLIALLKELLNETPLTWVLNMNIDLRPGLALEATGYHDLVLSILLRSDQDSARRLATNNRDLFQDLVQLWLLAENISTGEQAGKVLLNFIKVDRETLVTKRLFRDREIYESIYTLCDSKEAGSTKARRSTSQLRLLSWLAELAKHHWILVNESFHPEVEESHGVPRDQGLLDFATNHMVRDTTDVVSSQRNNHILPSL